MSTANTLYIDTPLVDKAVTLWRDGQLVAIPTETVYGLGADATNGEAVARIYSVKSRPQFNPLIVHVPSVEVARRYVEWNAHAEALAAQFWPGPLTMVLARRADCPLSALASAGGDTVGIRIPAHPVARQLLAAFDGGIAAPSANRSGRISPTQAAHVVQELGDAIPLVVDGGACDVGLESTVVDVTGAQVALLRPGSITREMLAAVVPLADGVAHTGAIHRSPGQLESHYAPSVPVRLNATSVGEGEALLSFGQNAPAGAVHERNLSPSGDLIEAAANLFAHLRALDEQKPTAIAVMPIPDGGIGEAINDRLRRAAVPA